MSKKERKRNRRVVGAPEIARPNKRQGAFVRAVLLDAPRSARHELKQCFDQLLPYEKQLALVYAWFFDRLELLESDDKKEANVARGELQGLFLNLKDQLMRIAQKKKGSKAKRWAGWMLAHIYKRIEKHHKKLCKANTSYAKECAKIGSKSVTSALFPRSPITKVVRRELIKAVGYQKRLILLSASKDWRESAKRKRIPEAYWPLIEFPEFSVKWEAKW